MACRPSSFCRCESWTYSRSESWLRSGRRHWPRPKNHWILGAPSSPSCAFPFSLCFQGVAIQSLCSGSCGQRTSYLKSQCDTFSFYPWTFQWHLRLCRDVDPALLFCHRADTLRNRSRFCIGSRCLCLAGSTAHWQDPCDRTWHSAVHYRPLYYLGPQTVLFTKFLIQVAYRASSSLLYWQRSLPRWRRCFRAVRSCTAQSTLCRIH